MSFAPRLVVGTILILVLAVLILLWGAEREFLVPDAGRRAELWTSRVWPGAMLLGGEIVGTWRRSKAEVAVAPWRTLSFQEREAVEAEAASLPFPGVSAPAFVRWDSGPISPCR